MVYAYLWCTRERDVVVSRVERGEKNEPKVKSLIL